MRFNWYTWDVGFRLRWVIAHKCLVSADQKFRGWIHVLLPTTWILCWCFRMLGSANISVPLSTCKITTELRMTISKVQHLPEPFSVQENCVCLFPPLPVTPHREVLPLLLSCSRLPLRDSGLSISPTFLLQHLPLNPLHLMRIEVCPSLFCLLHTIAEGQCLCLLWEKSCRGWSELSSDRRAQSVSKDL